MQRRGFLQALLAALAVVPVALPLVAHARRRRPKTKRPRFYRRTPARSISEILKELYPDGIEDMLYVGAPVMLTGLAAWMPEHHKLGTWEVKAIDRVKREVWLANDAFVSCSGFGPYPYDDVRLLTAPETPWSGWFDVKRTGRGVG